MNKQQEPRLRFQGFTGEWEEKKVIDFSPLQRGFDLPVSKITEGDYPVVFSNGILKLHNQYKVKGVGIVTGRSGTIGEVTFVEKDFWPHNTALWVTNFFGNNPQFVFHFLKNFDLSRFATGSGVPTLNRNDVHNQTIYVPKFEEQTAIGNFFRRLDSQIAESRAVLEKSRQLKKAMLAKMFPANGEKIPKIRFKGFEGEWERKKLGEIAFKVKEKNIAYQYAETFTNSAEFGIISQQDFFDKSISNSENIGGYYVVQPDDFVYNPRISSFAPVGPIKRNKLGRTGVMSPLYYVFRLNDEIKPSYLEQYFEGNQWHHFMYLNGDTGARSDRFAIKNDVFAEMPISFPANKNEQTAIGNFFRQLDETIALQSAEVEKLNQLKKGLLAAMLV